MADATILSFSSTVLGMAKQPISSRVLAAEGRTRDDFFCVKGGNF